MDDIVSERVLVGVGITLVLTFLIFLSALLLSTDTPTGNVPKTLHQIVEEHEEVTLEAVEQGYEQLPVQRREQLTKEEYATGLVNEQLLTQEAEKQEITTTEEEVDQYIEIMAAQVPDLEEQLAAQGYTMSEYRDGVKELLTISKLVNQELDFEEFTVSEREVDQFLAEHEGEFNDIFEEEDPELEAIFRAQVERRLIAEKQQAAMEEYLGELRNDV